MHVLPAEDDAMIGAAVREGRAADTALAGEAYDVLVQRGCSLSFVPVERA